MSHFTVLVVGEDHEYQLAPFHEYECTGFDDEFVRDVDVTEECRAHADDEDPHGLGWHGLEDRVVEDESALDRTETHKYGYAIVRNGTLIRAVRRTNPDKKWDWYQVGGRWRGFFRLKPGRSGTQGKPSWGETEAPDADQVDVAEKGAVDFARMRDEAAQRAGERWDRVHAVIDAHPPIEPWRSVLARFPDNVQQARDTYWQQPGMQALEAAKDDARWDGPDRYLVPRDVYVQQAREMAAVPFAVVIDRQWYEKGSMGWWGMVADEEDQAAWNARVQTLYDGLPDYARLTLVDCHI